MGFGSGLGGWQPPETVSVPAGGDLLGGFDSLPKGVPDGGPMPPAEAGEVAPAGVGGGDG